MSSYKSVYYWLFFICFLMLCITFLGGYTRLSGAGLSIVEWKPIVGIVPPLTEDDWLGEFNKYTDTPEFKQINTNITMGEFKRIYLIEYFHRLLGRLIGICFIIPLIYYSIKRVLPKNNLLILCTIPFLGMLQGIIGWIMVQSGLINIPQVNHWKLSIHLTMALVILMLTFKQGISFYYLYHNIRYKYDNNVLFILILVIIQIFLGGLVSGLKAGMIYNTFPLMDGELIPQALQCCHFNDQMFVQFLHRSMAFFILLSIIYFSIIKTRRYITILLLALIQIALGIGTLLYHVPIFLASFHQLMAFIISIFLVWKMHIKYS